MKNPAHHSLLLSLLVFRKCCGLMFAGLALAVMLAHAHGARADSAPIPSSPVLPSSDPNHRSPLELLASRIASHIAGRSVSVHCETSADYATVVTGAGGNPAWAGFVAAQWDSASGQLVDISNVAELSSSVCGPLQHFAAATSKPTKCDGAPCFANRQAVVSMSASFWAGYERFAVAIRTLAHESVHLGGIVGARLSTGATVGDQQAEAKAECYGMQWMPYVAQQLGDSVGDARAIAKYFWTMVYPTEKSTAYWSADCRPGGSLDLGLAGSVWS